MAACVAPPAQSEVFALGVGQSNDVGPNGTYIVANPNTYRGFDLDSQWASRPDTLNNGSPYLTPTNTPWAGIDGPHIPTTLLMAEFMSVPYATLSTGKDATSADDWAVSYNRSTLFGGTHDYVIRSGLRPNILYVYQGEADTIVEADALAWAAKWRVILGEFALRYNNPINVVTILPDIPNPPGRNYWQLQRSVAMTLSDIAVLVQAPDTSGNADVLHLTLAQQLVHAENCVRAAGY